MVRSPYTPYPIYLRGTIGFRAHGERIEALKGGSRDTLPLSQSHIYRICMEKTISECIGC